MGGNAVLGYQTFFDFENNGNIVARAIGTACTLKRVCTLQVIEYNVLTAVGGSNQIQAARRSSQ